MALLATTRSSPSTIRAVLYDATETAELGEPGALDALINLKLSPSAQFADKAGSCALVQSAAAVGDDVAARRLPECVAS